MKPIQIPALTPIQCQRTRRTRTSASHLPLGCGRTPKWYCWRRNRALRSARLPLHEREATGLRWLKPYRTAGLEGVYNAPDPCPSFRAHRGLSGHVTRRHTLAISQFGLPCSLWTLQRLVDDLAEHRGFQGSNETVRHALQQAWCSAVPSTRSTALVQIIM
jgi:hypothetical protein